MTKRVSKSVARASLAVVALLAFDRVGHASDIEMADVLITHGTVITMDPARRVIDDGAVAVVGSRITAVGTTAEVLARFRPRQTIDATRKVVMPGLIDGHGHAGHELLKTLAADNDDWDSTVERLFAHGSTPEFWKADAGLAGLERLKFGVTTSVNFLAAGRTSTEWTILNTPMPISRRSGKSEFAGF